MIRPEAKAQLHRWREVLIGLLSSCIGLWLSVQPGYLLKIPGVVLVIAGLALIWIGVLRGRFRAKGAGPGSVDVDEGRVHYFGPLTGGSVDLRELNALIYDPSLHPAHWRLQQPGQPPLLIPVNAAGAEGLFDAFAALPGLRMEQLLRTTRNAATLPTVVWQRETSATAQNTLH